MLMILGFNLVSLANKWFGSSKILKAIENLGHTYVIRLKGNIRVYKDNTKTNVKKFKHKKYRSFIYNDVHITDDRFKTNIVYSNSCNTKEPWILATNGDTSKTISSYSYRFGSIETMYTMVCTCVLFLTILGADYTKNTKCYKEVKITTHKVYEINGKKVKKRILSLFNTGLTLFKRAINSNIYIRIPVSFKLYNI